MRLFLLGCIFVASSAVIEAAVRNIAASNWEDVVTAVANITTDEDVLVVEFAAAEISATSALLVKQGHVVLRGSESSNVVISRANSTFCPLGAACGDLKGSPCRRIIRQTGGALTVERLTLTGGYCEGSGGAFILEAGTAVIKDAIFKDNKVAGPSAEAFKADPSWRGDLHIDWPWTAGGSDDPACRADPSYCCNGGVAANNKAKDGYPTLPCTRRNFVGYFGVRCCFAGQRKRAPRVGTGWTSSNGWTDNAQYMKVKAGVSPREEFDWFEGGLDYSNINSANDRLKQPLGGAVYVRSGSLVLLRAHFEGNKGHPRMPGHALANGDGIPRKRQYWRYGSTAWRKWNPELYQYYWKGEDAGGHVYDVESAGLDYSRCTAYYFRDCLGEGKSLWPHINVGAGKLNGDIESIDLVLGGNTWERLEKLRIVKDQTQKRMAPVRKKKGDGIPGFSDSYEPCPPGMYSSGTGGDACTPCSRGQSCDGWARSAPSICPEGRYCPQGKPSRPCPKCKSGFECKPGLLCNLNANSSDTIAKVCPDGFFCPGDTTELPKPCNAGQLCKAGSVTADGEGLCPAGFGCPSGEKMRSCKAGFFCPKGSESDRGSSTSADCVQKPKFCPCDHPNYCCPAGSVSRKERLNGDPDCPKASTENPTPSPTAPPSDNPTSSPTVYPTKSPAIKLLLSEMNSLSGGTITVPALGNMQLELQAAGISEDNFIAVIQKLLDEGFFKTGVRISEVKDEILKQVDDANKTDGNDILIYYIPASVGGVMLIAIAIYVVQQKHRTNNIPEAFELKVNPSSDFTLSNPMGTSHPSRSKVNSFVF